MPKYIRLDENNVIIATRIGAEIVEGEIESDLGECGDIMQGDGTFITPEPPVLEPDPKEGRLNNLEVVIDTMLKGGVV